MIHDTQDIIDKILERSSSTKWVGFDPYDGLESRIFGRAISKTRIGSLLFVQFNRVCPVNVRHLLRVPRLEDPKAMALFGRAMLMLYDAHPNKSLLVTIPECLDLLAAHRSPFSSYFSVAQNRTQELYCYSAQRGSPGHFLTVLTGETFLQAYHTFEEPSYLELALQIAKYFINEAPLENISEEEVYFSYKPLIKVRQHSTDHVYNLSALIGSYLVTISQFDQSTLKIGRAALKYVCSSQNEDGSWFYSQERKYIDNFHTAFILIALKSANNVLKDPEIEDAIAKGLQYYMGKLFRRERDTLSPLHFDTRYLPKNSNLFTKVDIRDCALSITLFALLSTEQEIYGDWATRILEWTLQNMWDEKRFFFEKSWLWTNKLEYISLQAWMVLALASYERHVVCSEGSRN